MYKLLICGIFAFVALTEQAHDQPTKCYHCTLLNGNICNEPVLSKVGIQSCSDIPNHKNSTDKVVCYTVTATWLGQPITERGCWYQEIEGEDVCSFFKRTEANVPFTFDYTCKLCYDDLCNGLPSR